MATESGIDRVGLGVDLFGGNDTLATLRSIRFEMKAIAELAQTSKIPTRITGAQAGNPNQRSLFDTQERLIKESEDKQTQIQRQAQLEREKEYKAHLSRMEREKLKAREKLSKSTTPISDEEVKAERLAQQRRKQIQEDVIRDTEAVTARRRAAIGKTLKMLDEMDQKELMQARAHASRIQKFYDDQVRAENARAEKAEQLRQQRANRRRGPSGQFMSDAEIAREDRSNAARERAAQRPRGPSGRFLTRDEIAQREEDQGRFEAQRAQRVAISQRVNENARRAEERDRQRRQEEERAARLEQQRLDDERRAAEKRLANERRQNKGNNDYQAARREIADKIATDRFNQKNLLDSAKATVTARNPIFGPTREQDFFGDASAQTKLATGLQDQSQRLRSQLTGRGVGALSPAGRTEAGVIYNELNRVGLRAQELKQELNSVNMKRSKQEITADLKAIEREFQSATDKARRLRESELGLRGTGGGKGPNLKDPTGLLNEKGFFTTGDAVGRITRNILLYEVVSRSTYGLVDYVQQSLQAAKASIELANAMRFATEAANGNLAANEQLVESERKFGLSVQQGRKIVTEAARFTENRPQDINGLVKVATDIAAERGGGIDKTDELIEQLRRRESKFYKRIFGKTVESIYEDEARAKVRSRTNADSFVIGKDSRNFKTEEEQIKSYVAALDDAGKENAVLNYILSQGSRFSGEAAMRAETLAGRMDKLNASFANAQETVGLFVTEIKPISNLIDSLANKFGFLEKFRAPMLGRSGTGGTITDSDLRQFAIDKTTGPRAELLDTINNYGGAAVLGAGAFGALALGGRRQANLAFRTQTFNKELPSLIDKFGGDVGAAQQEARALAMDQKAGLFRSAKAGLNRITFGMSQSILSAADEVAARIGNEKVRFATTALKNTVTNPLAQFSGSNEGVASIQNPQFYRVPSVSRDPVTGRFVPYTGTPRATVESYFNNPSNYGMYGGSNVSITSGRANRTADNPFFNLDQVSERNRAYFEERNNATQARIERASQTGGVLGGTVGGLAGATLGTIVANAINAGPLTATTLTVLGGAVGTTAGTAIGSVTGAGLSSAITAAGGFSAVGAAALPVTAIVGLVAAALGAGALIGTTINQVIPASVPFLGTTNKNKEIERQVRNEEVISQAYAQKALEMQNAYRENRVYFRSTRAGDNYTERLSGAQVAQRVAQGQGNLGDYQYQIEQGRNYSGYEKLYRDQQAERDQLIRDTNNNPTAQQMNALRAKQEQDALNIGGLGQVRDEARSKFAETWQKRQEEEARKEQIRLEKRNAMIQQQAQALNKLRDAQQGSFRVVEEIANAYAGPENPYTKIFTDGATAAERMRQQWGFLGQTTVDYFTNLEKRSIGLQQVKVSFNSLAQSQELLNKAAREADQRSGPGDSTRSTLGANVLGQAIGSFIDIQNSYKEQAKTVGSFLGFNGDFYNDPIRSAKDQISQITGLGAGLSDFFGVSQRQKDELLSSSIGGILGDLNPRQIRNDPFLRDAAFNNFERQRRVARAKLDDEFLKFQLNAQEGQRLTTDLGQADQKRSALLKQGLNARDVGQSFDRFVISRTDGIDAKDLTYEQFQQRQNALRREAERTVGQEEEARAALKQGLAYQAQMTKDIEAIRAAIVGGDLSMLIQVQNDTQARIDQESLQDSNPNFAVPLDTGAVKVNPYSSSFARYGRGGNKR